MTDPVLTVHQTISINLEIVRTLERLLEDAVNGKVIALVYAVEETNKATESGFEMGKKGNYIKIVGMLEDLKYKILEAHNE